MPQHPDSSIRIGYEEEVKHGARIKVVGVGGGGNNAVNRMIEAGLSGVEFISVNTDLQPLENSNAHVRLQLGTRITRGLGTGANPDVGRRAALEDSEKIIEALEGADMVFVTAGLGGGTGTGAAPVVAALASQMEALTVAIVTRPFGFEGKRRMAQAERGVQELLDHVDTLVVIPNDKLMAVAKDIGFFDSFRIADDVLRQAVQGITDIITVRGVINRDLADVRTTMAGMGYAVMGTATRTGPNRAAEAAMAAIASPLIEAGAIDGARGILINITGSSSLKLSEVSHASTIIQQAAHEDAIIIFGAVLDERLEDEVKVTVIATGFRDDSRDRTERRLHMLTPIEQPTIHFQDTPLRGTYAPIRPHVASAPAPNADPVGPDPVLGPVLGHESAAGVETLSARPPIVGKASAEEGTQHSPAIEEQPFAEAPELYFTNEWFDDDVLAKAEALAFDANSVAEEGTIELKDISPGQPEIARLRQTALAAYAASSLTEHEDEEPAVLEEATFADVMASRTKILESISLDGEPHGVLLNDSAAGPKVVVGGASGFINSPAFRNSTAPLAERRQERPVDNSVAQIPSFTGIQNRDELSTELNELDIPAFLRRS